MLGQVSIVHTEMMMMCHVIVLTEVIVQTSDHCGGRYTIDHLSVLVLFDETVKSVIDNTQEKRHAKKRLKNYEEVELGIEKSDCCDWKNDPVSV